jgi:hypothetical protein
MTNQGLEGKIRVGTMNTDYRRHEDGSNQGAKLAAKEWAWMFQDLSDNLEEVDEIMGAGTRRDGTWEGRRMVAQYVDDVSMMVDMKDAFTKNGERYVWQGEVAQGAMKKLEDYAHEERCSWARGKTEFIVVGNKKE